MSQSRFQYAEKRNYLSPQNTAEDYNEMIRSMTEILKDSQKDTIVDPVINRFFSLSEFQANVLPMKVPSAVKGRSFFSHTLSRYDRFDALVKHNPRLYEYVEQLKNAHNSVNDEKVHVMDSLIFKTAHNVIQFFVFTSILYVMVYMKSDLFGADKKVTFGRNQLDISNPDVTREMRPPVFKDDGLMDSLTSTRSSRTVVDQKSLIRDLYDIFQEMNVRNDLYLAHVPGNIQKNNNITKQQDYIDSKEKEFNRRKSYVITMVNKNHRVRDSYDRKYFWTSIQFFALILILVTFMAITYSVRGNPGQAQFYGMLLLAVSAACLSVMSIYGVITK